MFYFISGSDREKTRAALKAKLEKVAKGTDTLRITDAHTVADLQAALQGGGMFATARVVVFEGIFGNEEMRAVAEEGLKHMRDSKETFFILEDKLDANTRKQIEKYAEKSEKFDAVKEKEDKTIFKLADALRSGNKKALWVGYQKELQGSAPEAIHGVLFWAAKQMLGFARSDKDKERAQKIIAELAALPHESRRRGVELEYSLEKFVLTIG